MSLPQPWFRPADRQAEALRREALAEIGPDHELAGRDLVTVAACGGCDRVVFQVDDGTFAIIHLTWSKTRPEQVGYPKFRRIGSLFALRHEFGDHDH
jgi:hypothetical protein